MSFGTRCFVERERRAKYRVRRYKVVCSEYVPHEKSRFGVRIVYTVLSRHFTAQGAYRAMRAANRERGNGIH